MFHINVDVIGFFGQFRPTKMLGKVKEKKERMKEREYDIIDFDFNASGECRHSAWTKLINYIFALKHFQLLSFVTS